MAGEAANAAYCGHTYSFERCCSSCNQRGAVRRSFVHQTAVNTLLEGSSGRHRLGYVNQKRKIFNLPFKSTRPVAVT